MTNKYLIDLSCKLKKFCFSAREKARKGAKIRMILRKSLMSFGFFRVFSRAVFSDSRNRQFGLIIIAATALMLMLSTNAAAQNDKRKSARKTAEVSRVSSPSGNTRRKPPRPIRNLQEENGGLDPADETPGTGQRTSNRRSGRKVKKYANQETSYRKNKSSKPRRKNK